jgi:hypothetical protein
VEELLLSAIECTGASDVRQTEIYTAEPFVPEPSASEFKVTIRKLKRCKSPGSGRGRFGGVVVSVFATGPKGSAGSNPAKAMNV